ncbi:MAG: hypothetical protein KA264_07630 [Crocinitomicaceae bacterium]|jgi:hypothetical protein|nr:hypothetical protein [Crocinitomicaceae bacterium]
MKAKIITLSILFISLISFGQQSELVKGDCLPFMQANDGLVIIHVKIRGNNDEDARINAEKYAIYCVLFEGYVGVVSKNIPNSSALAGSSLVYDNNRPFFDDFFKDEVVKKQVNQGKYKSYIQSYKFHPTLNPSSPVGKKQVECNYVITIKRKLLYEYLTNPQVNIITAVSKDGPKPSVIVIPFDKYLDDKGYYKEIDENTVIYDLVNGCKDENLLQTISYLSSSLTGPGKSFNKIDIAQAQAAISMKDAVNEMSSGPRKVKVSASQRLKQTANWDYSIKVNVIKTVSGTARNIQILLKVVDMYNAHEVEVDPVNVNFSSADDENQQTNAALAGAIEALQGKIDLLNQEKMDKGFNGKVSFHLSSTSKLNFDSETQVNDEAISINEYLSMLLLEFSDKINPPQLDGSTDPLTINYRDVIIPFWTTGKDLKGNVTKKVNSFAFTGSQIISILKKQFPESKFVKTENLGSVDIYLDLK